VIESGPSRSRSSGGHRRVLDGCSEWHARAFRSATCLLSWATGTPDRRWTISGLWDVLLQALADGGGDATALQMINSTIVQAHPARA